jgi:sulfide:quinone oxidoreductase
MERKRVVIVGSSFAGYTGAIELKELLGSQHDVMVIAKSHDFVFIPSLIWYPFGIRNEEDITFDVRPQLAEKGIEFLEAEVTGFDPEGKRVLMGDNGIEYDYLLIATGPKVDFDSVSGLGPEKNSWSICNLEHAKETKKAWERFLEDPGPIVIGAIQGAACFGAAYEFILNIHYQLKKHNILDKAPLTFLTAEPFLAHFGIGGFGNGEKMCEMMFKFYKIDWRTNAVVKEVLPDRVVLESGEEIASKFTMLIPRFLGIDAVRNTPGLANKSGFIELDEGYQHRTYPEIYAAGVAVSVAPPGETPVACGVPKTGYPSEQMAKTAAHNIHCDIMGGERKILPFGEIEALCILDTGNMGMMIIGDHMLAPRSHEWIIPGPQAHWAKVAFEKYFMSSRSRGHV